MAQQSQIPWPAQQPLIGSTRQPNTYQAQGSTRQPGITQQPSTCLLYTSPSPRDPH